MGTREDKEEAAGWSTTQSTRWSTRPSAATPTGPSAAPPTRPSAPPRPTPPTPTSAPPRLCRSLCSSAPPVTLPSATMQDQREEPRRRTRKRTTKEEIKEETRVTVFSAVKSLSSIVPSQAGQEMWRLATRFLNSHREKSANRFHSRPATRSPARPATRWLSTDLSGRLGESVIKLSQPYFQHAKIKYVKLSLAK